MRVATKAGVLERCNRCGQSTRSGPPQYVCLVRILHLYRVFSHRNRACIDLCFLRLSPPRLSVRLNRRPIRSNTLFIPRHPISTRRLIEIEMRRSFFHFHPIQPPKTRALPDCCIQLMRSRGAPNRNGHHLCARQRQSICSLFAARFPRVRLRNRPSAGCRLAVRRGHRCLVSFCLLFAHLSPASHRPTLGRWRARLLGFCIDK